MDFPWQTKPCVMIAGVPGVGKSTISNGVRDRFNSVGIADFGELMGRLGVQSKMIRERAELRTLGVESRARLQKLVAKYVTQLSRKQPLMIDGHLAVDTPTGFVPGVPSRHMVKFRLIGILLIVADPQEINARRLAFHDREKYALNINEPERIDIHQNLTTAAAWSFARQLDASFEVLPNVRGLQEQTVSRAADWIDHLIPLNES